MFLKAKNVRNWKRLGYIKKKVYILDTHKTTKKKTIKNKTKIKKKKNSYPSTTNYV